MVLAADLDNWFTLPGSIARHSLATRDKLQQLYQAAKQLAREILASIHQNDVLTTLFSKLRLLVASTTYNVLPPSQWLGATRFRITELQTLQSCTELVKIHQAALPLFECLQSLSTLTDISYAVESFLGLLSLAELTMLQVCNASAKYVAVGEH